MDVKKIRSYDYDVARQNFLSDHAAYFKAVYFDFAPLLALPVYQERPVHSLNPLPDYSQKYSTWEYEALANALNPVHLAHPQSKTPAILKATYLSGDGTTDHAQITAYSYDSIGRVDVIPMLGGDGRMHGVPVHWDEYIPLECVSQLGIGMSESDNQNSIAQIHAHGLYARVDKL